MKRAFGALLVVGMTGLVGFSAGCEEKKADPLSSATDTMKDAAKKVGNETKAAADKAGDAMKGAADKAKDMGKELADKARGEVQNLMDTAKTKIDALVAGGSKLPADKKPEFDKAVGGIQETFGSLNKDLAGLKDKAADALGPAIADLKSKGEKLMDSIKSTATKFGITL